MIEEASLFEEPYGIERVQGRCVNASQDPTKDQYAFRFKHEPSSLVASYAYPEGFPEDFSILMVLRQAPGSFASAFALYNTDGEEQIVVNTGRNVSLYCKDNAGYSRSGGVIFGVSVDDAE